MKRRHFLWALTFLLPAYALVHVSARDGNAVAARTIEPPRRGVNLCGAEFGADRPDFSNENPGACGREYTYNSPRTYGYFCDRGLGLLRLPIRWERLQPRLGADFNPGEAARLVNAVARAKRHGGSVLVDIHNYGRYTLAVGGVPTECVIDQPVGGTVPVTRAHFADLWRRLSRLFRDEPAVYGYGLMNEPHDMGTSDWRGVSQAAVDAVRAEGDRKLILVAGDDWSRADRFAAANPAPWINDPADNVAYEAHCYFDRDGSGRYALSYDRELASDPDLADRPLRRLAAFTEWCRVNRVRGFVGEFGVPGNDPRWLPLLSRFVGALDRAGLGGCYWAAGEWWGDYPLAVQPDPRSAAPAPQLAVLAR